MAKKSVTMTILARALLVFALGLQGTTALSENPYKQYSVPFSKASDYARLINEPWECYGHDLEVFEQLNQSNEWQMCAVDDQLHMCQTEAPDQILLYWQKNNVKEDSFFLGLRRKSKWVDTNFFVDNEAAAYYHEKCPVDMKYAKSDFRCTGSAVNGQYNFYPSWSQKACQCQVVLDKEGITKESSYSTPPIKYATFEQQVITISKSQSPCNYLIQNESRKNFLQPNLWTKMNSIRINITITKIPPGGKVYLYASFKPDFYMNEPVTQRLVIDKARTQPYSFKSTDEIFVMTFCSIHNQCKIDGDFEFTYQKVEIPVIKDDFPNWSMIITVYIGFSIMFLALLFFEGPTIYRACKRCRENGCKRSSQNTISNQDNQDFRDIRIYNSVQESNDRYRSTHRIPVINLDNIEEQPDEASADNSEQTSKVRRYSVSQNSENSRKED